MKTNDTPRKNVDPKLTFTIEQEEIKKWFCAHALHFDVSKEEETKKWGRIWLGQASAPPGHFPRTNDYLFSTRFRRKIPCPNTSWKHQNHNNFQLFPSPLSSGQIRVLCPHSSVTILSLKGEKNEKETETLPPNCQMLPDCWRHVQYHLYRLATSKLHWPCATRSIDAEFSWN